MNRFNWIVQSINVLSFLLVGVTAFLLLNALFSPKSISELPSVQVNSSEDSSGSVRFEEELPSLSRAVQVLSSPDFGPQVTRNQDTQKKQKTNCDASKYVKEIRHVHPEQGVHLRLRGMKKLRYLQKNMFYYLASLKDQKSKNEKTGPQIAFVEVKGNKLVFGFKGLPGQSEEVCKDSIQIPPAILKDTGQGTRQRRNRNGKGASQQGSESSSGAMSEKFSTKKIGKHSWQVDPEEKKWAIKNMKSLLQGMSFSSVVRDGQIYGLRITSLAESALAGKRGFQEGDIVMSVNGRKLSSLSTVKQLAKDNEFVENDKYRVKVERSGRKPFTMKYSVKK